MLRSVKVTVLSLLMVAGFLLGPAQADGSAIAPFLGTYKGQADLLVDGRRVPRNMDVEIAETRGGFSVQWTSTTLGENGAAKSKTYAINFQPSDRPGIFSAAMAQDVFGNAVPLDPMKGEPYVWGVIEGETLSVYSLLIGADGGYDMQEFHRSLAEGGLDLRFRSVGKGQVQRSLDAFLRREGAK